jgi:hypothetical protein
MSILPQLEHDLRAAAARRAAARGVAEPRRRRRVLPRLHLTAASLTALLAGATISLAATAVILTGSPVHEPAGSPAVGLGLPAAGGARLLALRVPDPDGGLPWGMRLVRTTRGAVCMQVGRVQDGKLGVLGVAGAFGNDGRFHELLAGDLASAATARTNLDESCEIQPPPASSSAPSQTSSNVLSDTNVSATTGFGGRTPVLADRRVISYGLLGPNAVSIRYSDATGQHTVAVSSPDGGYLIVQRASPSTPREEAGAFGIDQSDGEILNPIGAVTAVTYRIHGRLCSDQPVAHLPACPQPSFTATTLAPVVPVGHEPLHPRLTIRDGHVTALTVRFVAPYAVTTTDQMYLFVAQACPPRNSHDGGAFREDGTFRDVAAGEVVTLAVRDPFAHACGRALTASVTYSYPQDEQNVVLGTVSVVKPG